MASRLPVDTVQEIVHSLPRLHSQVLLTAVEEAEPSATDVIPELLSTVQL